MGEARLRKVAKDLAYRAEEFSIQLSIAGKDEEKRKVADAGTRQAIYLRLPLRHDRAIRNDHPFWKYSVSPCFLRPQAKAVGRLTSQQIGVWQNNAVPVVLCAL